MKNLNQITHNPILDRENKKCNRCLKLTYSFATKCTCSGELKPTNKKEKVITRKKVSTFDKHMNREKARRLIFSILEKMKEKNLKLSEPDSQFLMLVFNKETLVLNPLEEARLRKFYNDLP